MLKAAAFNPAQPMIQDYTDASGTPGNVTINKPRGRVSIANLASSLVVTNSLVTADSTVLASMSVAGGLLTRVERVTPAAGQFTITGNAAASSGGSKIDFLVIN